MSRILKAVEIYGLVWLVVWGFKPVFQIIIFMIILLFIKGKPRHARVIMPPDTIENMDSKAILYHCLQESNLTSEDKAMLWNGRIKDPVSGEYIDSEEAWRKVTGENPTPKKCRSPYVPYVLMPEVGYCHELYHRANGRYLWEDPAILKLNTMEALSQVPGFDGDTDYNWTLNGFIRISETEWGYVGKANMFSVFKMANPDWENDPAFLELNRTADRIYPCENDSTYTPDKIDTCVYYTDDTIKFYPPDIRSQYFPMPGEYYFAGQEPLCDPHWNALLKIGNDKYIPAPIKTVYEFHRKLYGCYPFENNPTCSNMLDFIDLKSYCIDWPQKMLIPVPGRDNKINFLKRTEDYHTYITNLRKEWA